MLMITALFVLSFLIGGIPTGFILVKIFKKKDIRNFGSGNIGFANVLRTNGIILGITTLFIDVSKSFLATYFISSLFTPTSLFRLLLGITVILGNIFTPFLKFRGGKGVATGLGVALAINPIAAGSALCGFLITVKLSKYISLGSLVAVTVFAVSSFLFYTFAHYDIYTLIFSLLIFVAIVARHISNVKRLILGLENKIGQVKSGG